MTPRFGVLTRPLIEEELKNLQIDQEGFYKVYAMRWLTTSVGRVRCWRKAQKTHLTSVGFMKAAKRTEDALPAAAAVELIITSLIHDDIEDVRISHGVIVWAITRGSGNQYRRLYVSAFGSLPINRSGYRCKRALDLLHHLRV